MNIVRRLCLIALVATVVPAQVAVGLIGIVSDGAGVD